MKTILFLFFTVFLFSCSENENTKSCESITVDSVKIIDSLSIDSKTYYLVYRISGWQDKTEVLELYDSKPVFDHCSKSNIEEVFGDSLELSYSVSHVYLNTEQNTLNIKYSNEPLSKKGNKSHLKLEIK